MKIETHFINDINENEYNPRIVLDRFSKEYNAIKKSINDYGFVEPIVVNDITMSCIGGHQRLAVMRDMGAEQIDCVMVHIESPEKEKALCIALNKIKGDWDYAKLDELLLDTEIRAFELGFDSIEVSLEEELNINGFDFDGYGDVEDDVEDDSIPQTDDDITDAVTFIKVGSYHFEITISEYKEMIDSIRDKGLFGKSEIIEELRRKLFSD